MPTQRDVWQVVMNQQTVYQAFNQSALSGLDAALLSLNHNSNLLTTVSTLICSSGLRDWCQNFPAYVVLSFVQLMLVACGVLTVQILLVILPVSIQVCLSIVI